MSIIFMLYLIQSLALPANGAHSVDDIRLEESSLQMNSATGFETYDSRPWKNGIIPVEFDQTISKEYQNRFFAACQVWSDVAEVKCRPRSNSEHNHLFVTDQLGSCWTEVGAGKWNNRREFNFSFDWCWDSPLLIHEIGHVLGFMHEHQRPDRDQYIKVFPENAGKMSFAYKKLSAGKMDKRTAYDFLSIMHYWNAAYSTNGRLIMVPQAGYEQFAKTMGTSKTLSETDKTLVREIYNNSPPLCSEPAESLIP